MNDKNSTVKWVKIYT